MSTVFVVDDDPAVRTGLALLLTTAGLEPRTYGSPSDFIEAYAPELPGCLIADLRMPGMSGLELQDALSKRGWELPVIFLTGHGDVPAAVQALKGGALDFLEKPFDTDLLLDRVHEALARDNERRAASAEHRGLEARAATLTPREREVMARVAGGDANKVVAMELGISERTVEVHRSRVMRKMGARSVAELARMAQALGL